MSRVELHPLKHLRLPGKEFPPKGIFATCSPGRPNPICATTVQLLERKGIVLKVEGLDVVDGTPLDIKTYIPSYYAADEVKIADWMIQIEREFEGS